MNKKLYNILFICLISLFLISAVSANDENQTGQTIASTNYQITSDLDNEDIQTMLDGAGEGDTFEFTESTYNNISLVVDKKLNIISKVHSKVYTSGQLSSKAKELGITDTFGFYFTSNSAGSILSGITIIASDSDYGVIVDSAKNLTIDKNVITGGKNCILVKNAEDITLTNNKISKASLNGIQIQNTRNSVISKNDISYNKRSGIETSNIYYCNITNNTVHHNNFMGFQCSMFQSAML